MTTTLRKRAYGKCVAEWDWWLPDSGEPVASRLKQRTIIGVVAWANGTPAMAFVELKDNEFENNVDLANSSIDGNSP
jgi:hypothetical protein